MRRASYHGPVTTDHYGRQVPKHAHGTTNLGGYTASAKGIIHAVLQLYDRIVDPSLLVRRINITVAHVTSGASTPQDATFKQLDMLTDYEAVKTEETHKKAELERESGCRRPCCPLRKSTARMRF